MACVEIGVENYSRNGDSMIASLFNKLAIGTIPVTEIKELFLYHALSQAYLSKTEQGFKLQTIQLQTEVY